MGNNRTEERLGLDWILEVLRDLTNFARANDMHALASKADEAMRAAEVEIAARAPEETMQPRTGSLH